ncbi:MAG: phosphotransferase, partial [Oscillospiraceae bacterium]|nr:phosphotransferase [Oscillospiraceae bacterium]
MIHDIPGYDSFLKIEPINKGWSEDKKYCVTKADGTKLLLRVTPISRYETRKSLFDMLGRVAALDIPMCMPVEFGACENGVYSFQSWIDGEDLEIVLPRLSEAKQYVLGVKSGEIARKMHCIPAPDAQEEWETRFNRKTDMKIKKYNECGLRFDGDEHVLAYIEQNRDLLKNRPQCFQHGDYHIGNMMIECGELKIIDFDRYDFGDPWEEFKRIVWSAAASPHFATGQLRGYFGGEPPIEFFKLLTFYIASNTLSSIYWAVPFGQSELDTMMKQARDVLEWFDNMQNPVPAWYLKDYHAEWIAGVPICLKKPFDLSFIYRYGEVFKVVKHGEGSLNLCFGVENDNKKYFIKFAGAPNEMGGCISPTTDETIGFLKDAAQVYRDLEHPNLIKFIDGEEVGGGYANIFEWVEAECIGYPSPPSRQKFLNLPVEAKMQAFDDILDFHVHVAKQGYVAIDFYADQILYDFENNRTIICDIDFYQKSPYYGDKGAWGSSNFVSPEELVPGSRI